MENKVLFKEVFDMFEYIREKLSIFEESYNIIVKFSFEFLEYNNDDFNILEVLELSHVLGKDKIVEFDNKIMEKLLALYTNHSNIKVNYNKQISFRSIVKEAYMNGIPQLHDLNLPFKVKVIGTKSIERYV